MKTVTKFKIRLVFLYIGSFIATAFPLAVTVFLKRGEYMTTVGETVKLSAGIIIGGIFLLLKVVGKLRMPKRLVLYVIIVLMAYLLAPLLDDLILLGSMAIIGELCDILLFGTAIKKTKEKIVMEENATLTADKVEEVIKKYMGGA